MTEIEIEKQIQAIRKLTEKGKKSKEIAIRILEEAGIINQK